MSLLGYQPLYPPTFTHPLGTLVSHCVPSPPLRDPGVTVHTPPHTSQGPRGPGPGPSDTPQGPRRRPPLTGSPPSQSSRPPSPSRTPAPLGPQLPSPSPGAPSPLTPEGPGPPSPSPGAAAPSAPPAGPALTARDRPSDGGEEGSGVAHLGKGGGRHTAFTETAALPAAAAVFPQSTPRFINAVTSNAVLGRGEAPGMESPFPFRGLPPPPHRYPLGSFREGTPQSWA